MVFEQSQYLWLLLLLLPLGFLIQQNRSSLEQYFDKTILQRLRAQQPSLSKRTRAVLLLLSMGLVIIALARPVINHGEIKVQSSDIDLMVGFDISNSMFAQDVYPNRFSFAKQKFFKLLQDLPNARIGVIGFSSQAFLISPLTKDRGSLKFLVENMKFDNMSLKGTSIISALESTQRLVTENEKKALLLFTDGGDKEDYSQEIAYAKEHHIVVFVYAVGTQKGGVIKTPNGVLKDNKGNIVVVKLNPAIKELALGSGGAYLEQSIRQDDVRILAQNIQAKFKSTQKKEQTIRDTQQLFIYPLMVAILLLLISISSLPKRRAS